MDEIMEKPFPLVCEQVEQRWERWHPKKVKWPRRLLRLLGFKRKVILSIGVQERADINNKTLEPNGELTGFWNYDAQGWEPVDIKNVIIDSVDDGTKLITYGFAESCIYAVDRGKQIAVVSWYYLIEGMGIQDRSYTVTTEYRISETDGRLNFIVNNIKKSKEKLGYFKGDYV
jgi:hypothetical protein